MQGKKPRREKLHLSSDEDEASEPLLAAAEQKAYKDANETAHISKRSTAKGKRSYEDDGSDVSCGSGSPVKSRKRAKINEAKRSRRDAPKVSYKEADDASDADESDYEETKKAKGSRTKKPQTATAKKQKPVESDTDDTANESQLDESDTPEKNSAKSASSALASFQQEGGSDWRTASAIDY
jgi:hypothetical protein